MKLLYRHECLSFRDKETLNKRKRDTEDELRDKLSDMKQHAIISNQLFQLILDYVGYETKVESGTILEPIQPVEFFLVNQCVEVLRPQVLSHEAGNDLRFGNKVVAALYTTCILVMQT